MIQQTKEQFLNDRALFLDERERFLDEREQCLDEREQCLDEIEQSLDKREQCLDKREQHTLENYPLGNDPKLNEQQAHIKNLDNIFRKEIEAKNIKYLETLLNSFKTNNEITLLNSLESYIQDRSELMKNIGNIVEIGTKNDKTHKLYTIFPSTHLPANTKTQIYIRIGYESRFR